MTTPAPIESSVQEPMMVKTPVYDGHQQTRSRGLNGSTPPSIETVVIGRLNTGAIYDSPLDMI